MRFWLKWAIVALPVVICTVLWIRSYAFEEGFNRITHHSELTAGISTGKFFFAFLRANDWDLSSVHWSYVHRNPIDAGAPPLHWHLLGFGYEFEDSSGLAATTLEVPIWAANLIALLPLIWLYRRHRKRGKKGFPIEPIEVSSKESIPARTD